MTSSAAEQRDDTDVRTIKFPATTATQRALHESIGHLYDELAIAREGDEPGSAHPDELFEQLEALYVATAEESVSRLELRYERTEADDRE